MKNFSDGRKFLELEQFFGMKFFGMKMNQKYTFTRELRGKDKVHLGCVRKNTKIYLTIEGILIEIEANVKKKYDENMRIDLIEFQ